MSTEGPPVDAGRVLADLRELDRRTGGPGGARRVAWGQGWRDARALLGELLAEIGVEPDRDEAGNIWAYLPGASEPALAIGSHLDSVPEGGWLDGALGVMAALGMIRAWAESGDRPPRTLALIDFADEEGARFGRSLVGSSAFSGSLEPGEIAGLRDAKGATLTEALAENAVEVERMPEAAHRGKRVGAFLELHIEQGPVLESEGLAVAAVSGCAGVERFLLRFAGQTSHAGTTPMNARRDAALAAAETALAVEEIATRRGGVGTTGSLTLDPGIPTATAGGAELFVDLRHPDPAALAAMLGATGDAAAEAAGGRGCEQAAEPLWRIGPTRFDAGLVEHALAAARAVGGRDEPLVSGALHDAAEVARAIPAAMMFCASKRGLSHTKEEDTDEPDLLAAIEAFGALVNRVLARQALVGEKHLSQEET